MRKYTIKDLEEKNMIIFSAVMGSHAYGTVMPTSDIDIRGVFIQPIEDILGFGYVEQIADETNDVVFYEIKRFLELVQTNNPNILELLNAPEDCIKYKDPLFNLVLRHKNDFISKKCKMSFAGYAINQIKKAKGYNKKINWEESAMLRKNVLDFCYVLEDGGSRLFADWLRDFNNKNLPTTNFSQENFGLANIDHAHNIYAMYLLPETREGSGIVKCVEKANDVQLTSIPKGIPVEAYLTFNKDAYTTHCKKYKEYKEWLDNRNEDRFKMNKDHGKNYDSKNMMHTFRLLSMAEEIAKGEIIVRRHEEEIKTLMAIRKGEYDYDMLLKQAEEKIANLDELFDNSDLPDDIDKDLVNNLLITIRKLRYA